MEEHNVTLPPGFTPGPIIVTRPLTVVRQDANSTSVFEEVLLALRPGTTLTVDTDGSLVTTHGRIQPPYIVKVTGTATQGSTAVDFHPRTPEPNAAQTCTATVIVDEQC